MGKENIILDVFWRDIEEKFKTLNLGEKEEKSALNHVKNIFLMGALAGTHGVSITLAGKVKPTELYHIIRTTTELNEGLTDELKKVSEQMGVDELMRKVMAEVSKKPQ